MTDRRVAIVTGGGKGIGEAISKQLLGQNYHVVIAEKDSKLKKNAPHNAFFVECDVGSEKSVKKMVAAALSEYGRIDALVNNAGRLPDESSSFADLTLDLWNEFIQTNLTGHFLCIKHTFAHLKKAKGSIVNIASTRALQAEGNDAAYAASKGGIVALTHSLAVEFGPHVRVNCISPGWIHTQKTKLKEKDHHQHPAGRVGEPEDIANMVSFLLSQESSFITGQNFVVDGGMTIKMIYQ